MFKQYITDYISTCNRLYGNSWTYFLTEHVQNVQVRCHHSNDCLFISTFFSGLLCSVWAHLMPLTAAERMQTHPNMCTHVHTRSLSEWSLYHFGLVTVTPQTPHITKPGCSCSHSLSRWTWAFMRGCVSLTRQVHPPTFMSHVCKDMHGTLDYSYLTLMKKISSFGLIW